MYTEKEKAALDRWHGKLHVSIQDLVEIHRLCEDQNIEYDEVINYALSISYNIRNIFKEFIENFKTLKNNLYCELQEKYNIDTIMTLKFKQVIIMRTDLNMRKGKMIAQGAHAATTIFSTWFHKYKAIFSRWEQQGQKKICVSVNSEEELIEIYKKTGTLPSSLITDYGLTEFHGKNTLTCCAIGPYVDSEIDQFTGHLKLL